VKGEGYEQGRSRRHDPGSTIYKIIMRVLQFTDPDDLVSLTKKLPKCKFPEDFIIALQAKKDMIDILDSQR
jgi:hypothetical protein